MNVSMERDVLAELSTTVASYLTALSLTADCLEEACPDVGGPYRKRILRLRSRLSFDVNREAVKDSADQLAVELKDYASVVHRVQTQRSVELERGMLALDGMAEKLMKRQESNVGQILNFASELEQTPCQADPRTHSETAALRAATLRTLAENTKLAAAAAIAQIRSEITGLSERLAGATSIDPATGLMNRAEFERQRIAHQLYGATFSVILFTMRGPLSDQVMRQAGARLSTQFRHCDRVGRWSGKEFAVLFVGPDEMAETRATQVVTVISGRYTLDNGEIVETTAEYRVLPKSTEIL